MTHIILKSFGFLAIAMTLALFSVGESNANGISSLTKKAPEDKLTLVLGKAEVIAISGDVSDIIVSNPDVVEVGPVKDGQIYLIGRIPGTTNILILDQAGDMLRQISAVVNVDLSPIEDNLKKQLPKENIKVETIGDQVILSGTVADAQTAAKARDIASRFVTGQETVVNNIVVSGGQQVMIHVKVVEVTRNILNELGIETDVANVNSGNFSVGNTTGDTSTAPFGLSIDPSFGNGSLVYSSTGTGPIQLLIHALERDGLVNTLAQPNLTAISGENARFLAGGEFPIPSARDNNGNIIYEYRPFGVSLSFRPVVLGKDRINLQIATEVSEVSNELTLQLPGITVPSFSVRRAETTVELASGGSLMIAGLIESKAIERMNHIPGIKDVPILGALVRSESFTRNETELLVMITAYLVEPVAKPEAVREADAVQRPEPLNVALAQSMALSYGNVVNNYAESKNFGFILE